MDVIVLQEPDSVDLREHLDPDEIAAFLDGRLEGEDLKRIEARLADDSDARQELIKASRIISRSPQQQRRRSLRIPALGALAAAAAIVVILVQPRSSAGVRSPALAESRGLADESQRIPLVSPAEDESFSDPVSAFKWHSVKGATYTLVVSDDAGRIIYKLQTSDTSLVLPGTLRDSGSYYWSVDALAPSGLSATSGVRQFSISHR